jgi:replicative DNA helicase
MSVDPGLLAARRLAAITDVPDVPDYLDAELVTEYRVEDYGKPDWDRAVDGAEFVLDVPVGIPAIWGSGNDVLWPRGEALMIAGGQGLGKTTLGIQVLKCLVGLSCGNVLGLPVVDDGSKVLYLAMDRPSQISRAMSRQFNESHRAVLKERLVFWKGPPLRDVAKSPTLLADMAKHYDVGVVIVDSLKDAAVGLSDDTVGAQYNRARQHLLAQDVQLMELHHNIKRGPMGTAPTTINDIYGSTWLTSGAGSVVMLTGEPGDPVISFRHVKQPSEEVGPFTVRHDQSTGVMTVDHQVDLIDLVAAAGIHGLTAKDAAMAILDKAADKVTKSHVEKARRRLDKKADDGLLVRVDGGRGGGKAATASAWFLASGAVE